MLTRDDDVVLGDGATVRVRPVITADREALHRFLERLSADSLDLRCFNPRPTGKVVERMLTADPRDTCAVVAEYGSELVALAQYSRVDHDTAAAEPRLLVADAMQGRGLGTRLLEHLADHAREHGIRRLHAWVLGTNHRLLQVFVDSGFTVQSESGAGVVAVVLSLDRTPSYDARTAARASTATHASLGPFFTPTSLAVVGASRERGTVGAEILNNLRTTGYTGPIFPVHPTASFVQGLPAYARLTDIPQAVDLAVVAVPAAGVLDVARDAAAKHVKAMVVISAGFSETGAEGRAHEQELLGIVRNAGMRMIGPNCMGVLNAHPGVLLNATFSPVFPPAGRVALSTQSGALGLSILDYARRVNLGLSTFASIGNKADVSANDLIEYWSDDPNTSVILLYLESVGNPRKFRRLARDVGKRKAIVALKAGRSPSGARAASSHTGALAASETVVNALFHHAGVIRTMTVEEMFEAAMLLDRQPLPGGRRVAILTNAGGPGILAADACEAQGLTVARLREDTSAALRAVLPAAAGFTNPVDMLATASAGQYSQAMRALLDDPEVDSLVTIFIPPLVTSPQDVASAMKEVARTSAKPVLATFMGTEGAIPMLSPIPAYRFPESAIAALARVARYAEWRHRPAGGAPDLSTEVANARLIVEQALEQGEGWISPSDAQRLLHVMGVPVVPGGSVQTEDEAVEHADAIGYPVALKAVGSDIVHKTDVGGVKLNLGDEASLRGAFRALQCGLRETMSGAIIQRMALGGVEMFIGGLQDPVFGPVVLCGSGGVLVEVCHDAACRLAPLTDGDAGEMLDEIRGIARLRGLRGAPPADEAALKDAVLRVAALLDGCPEIQELDINPMSVFERGVRAIDVRIRVARQAQRAPTRRV